MGLLERLGKALWNEVQKPDSFVKGDEFESYIRDRIFTKDKYVLLQKTHDYTSNRNDYIESSKEPDFKFKSINGGIEFFVEAKYRSYFIDGAIEWCKPFQLRRYQDIDSRTPVYILIGVGNEPRDPEHIFFASLKDVKYTKLFRSYILKYEIRSNISIDESILRLPHKKS